MPPRKRTADSSPIVGGFSVADNATTIGEGPKGAPNLPPPDALDDAAPMEDVKRRAPVTKLEKNLVDFYNSIGLMTGTFLRDKYCGSVIVQQAEPMAQSMAEWAAEDPKVKAALEKMLTAGAFGKVIAAHAPVIMAIGAHHVPAVRSALFPQQDAEPAEPAPTDDYGNPVADAA